MEEISDPKLKVLETQRLLLRQFVPTDAAFILELLNEPSFLQNIGDRGVRTLSDAERYIETGPAASYARNGFGLYLVEMKEPHQPIGMCGLIKRDSLEDVDLGYAFLPRYWSKGYAIESVLAVMQYAKNIVRLERVVAVVDPNNQGSIRVLERAGFRFEKMVRLSAGDIELRLFAIEI
jgi:RimJ/RimL family protein N-acetyltransferase